MNQYQQIFEGLSLNSNCLLLTPNQRLSKHLQKHFQNFKLHQFQKNHGQTLSLFDTQILSIDTYLRFCFSECQDQNPLEYSDYLLLDSTQEKLIWQQIIEKSIQGETLLFKQQCAQEAAQAWRLIHDWQLSTDNFEKQHYFESTDILAFKDWEKEFKKQCRQQKWITQAQLYAFVIQAFKTQNLNVPEYVYFYGFDELHPAQKAFQNCLGTLQAKVENIPLSDHRARYQTLMPCKDVNEEIHHAAIWAQQISQQDASANIAIIFPDLAKNRNLILRSCIELFCPEKLISGENLYPLPFNISSGVSLSRVPLVAGALALLELNKIFTGIQSLDFESLSRVLLNRFISESLWPEFERLKIESELRDLQQEYISLKQFKKLIGTSTNNQVLHEVINEVETDIKQHSGKRTHGQWHALFLKQIKAFQWLADFDLDSESFQAMQKFRNSLNQFAELDNIQNPCPLDEALERLNNILSQQLFQAESKQENKKRIHILGTLEAAALDFSHIWICQMDDETWPPRPRPNSFLPFPLQKKNGLPHSTAQREQGFCKNITERYLAHCDFIIFSYAQTEKDKINKASPLISHIEQKNISSIANDFTINPDCFHRDKLLEKICSDNQWEYFNDQEVLPVSSNEKIRGGQSILQNQANCPFRAFAQHRLNLKSLPDIEEGINAMDRGSLLHELMENIWRDLQGSEKLKQLTTPELKSLLGKLSGKLLENNIPKFPYKTRALELELERAQGLALNLLEIEKQRPAFKIFDLEKPQKISLSGLSANIRIDRIDELEDGSLLYIDYKSGQTHQNKWLTPRTEEPQLPLYLISNDSGKSASAIAFVALNHGNLGYAGIGNSDDIAPGIINCAKENKNNRFEPEWDKQINLWQQDLNTLAKDFLAGSVQVDPKKAPQTCEYCAYKKLCRIQEILS